MTDAQPETTVEVHRLEGNGQTVVFKIWPGTGVDFEHNPFPDWDEAEVTWTEDYCPPFKENFGDEDPDSIDADRINAREMYTDLIKAGYLPFHPNRFATKLSDFAKA